MYTENVTLENRKRFERQSPPHPTLIDAAIEVAKAKLLKNVDKLTMFTPPETINGVYEQRENDQWTSGMNTGVLWLAYELTGDERFYNAAKEQVKTYYTRFETKKGLLDHDVGFVFSPSVVADYKVTGDQRSRQLALDAAELLSNCYSDKMGFIRRSSGSWLGANRALVDSMMNIPLLLFAGEETGKPVFTDKAVRHYRTTAKYLVREDGSTYHHYEFEPGTDEPQGGVTLQGFSDESCWSRGHSWLIYGYPIAYGYTHDEEIKAMHRAVTYYFLNKLPRDCIPYWDLVFTDGSTQPRDASAAAVSVCGLLEMCKYLDESDPDREIYKNAADQMMRALIQKCANLSETNDGLLWHVTHALPQGRGIDEAAVYGDYFYLEALLRYKKPDWNKYW